MTDACLTVPELAVRWKCDPRLVSAAIKDGRLKSVRVGPRKRIITMAEIKRFEGEEENQNAKNEKRISRRSRHP